MALKDRIREAMGALTAADLARATDSTPPAVKFWLDGTTKSLKAEKAARIEQATGYRASWIVTGRGPKRVDNAPQLEDLDNHPDLTRIRKVRLQLQAGITGFAVEADEEDGLPIYFRADWMAERGFKPYNLLALKVKGASMEPSLHDGDMVVINTADTTPRDGEAFAVNYEGEAVIKRLVRDGGEWWLSSDNPDQRRFARKRWVDGDSFIVGRVVHKQSERI